MTTKNTITETLVSIFNKTSAKIIIKVSENTVKGSFGRGKFKMVSYNKKTDSFDVHSYRVVGVEMVDESIVCDIMIEQLLEAVENA